MKCGHGGKKKRQIEKKTPHLYRGEGLVFWPFNVSQ
jgi:hypothetical protein